MSVNIQQADKTLKKVADTTVVNKSTVTSALGYTPVTPTELNSTETELTNSIGNVSNNLTTATNNLQSQIDALEGSTFDGDYNKLTNAPILNEADGSATFADEAGNIIAKIDNNGLATTNLTLNGDIELADEKLEIIDEQGNIVLRIDENGVETKNVNELKTQVNNISTQTEVNKSNIENIQKDLEIFNFGDEGGLTIADEQGNIIAKFDVAEDGSQTGLITTDVTFEYEEDKAKTLTALNTEVAINTGDIGGLKTITDNHTTAIASKVDKVVGVEDNLVSFGKNNTIKDSGKTIIDIMTAEGANVPTEKAVADYIATSENTAAGIYATKEELSGAVDNINTE